ncbi:MAG TPA: DNA polymerase I [Planctomycetota bacterium]|nr:DNA polymerase I [Planctomycetota bacterium]
MTQRIYIIDAHATIHRGYHMPQRGAQMMSRDGHPTSAAFYFVQVLTGMLSEQRPDFLVMAADSSGPTFRHEFYKEYKANRPPTPEDLKWQVPKVLAICEGYGIPVYRIKGYEADDIIATLADQAAAEGLEVYVVSSDKDLLQLVGGKVRVYDPAKNFKEGKLYGPEEVAAERGVPPERMIDYLGLVGDSSDNIPGVPGIGPKTAVELIAKYGDLEGVLANASKEKGKRKENLEKHADDARLSYKLATINHQVPGAKLDLEAARVKPPDVEKLLPIFQELGFSMFLKKLMAAAPSAGAPSLFGAPAAGTDSLARDYRAITKPSELRTLAHQLVEAEAVSVDTETTGVDPLRAELVGISFAIKEGEARYIPVRAPAGEPAAPLDEVRRHFGPLLENPRLAKLGQNIKYDLLVLARHGINLRGVGFDTMLADYLLSPGKGLYNIDALALEHLGLRKIATEEVIGKGDGQTTMDLVPLETVAKYACEDADVALRLAHLLRGRLVERGLLRLLEEVEVPLIEVLASMQRTGIRLDVAALKTMSKDLDGVLAAKEAEIHEVAGREFNIQSPKQLAELLFDELKLPVSRKTRTGRSTDEAALEALAGLHALPKLVLEYRGLAKLKNTYVDKLPEWINPETGRIHCSLNQTGTSTGRLSSSEPNLQNIPVRTELGRSIRACFVPEPGWLLVSADYSQIELRILAHYSQDEALLDAFRKDKDIHAFVAAQVNGVAEKDVTAEMRRQAKAVNFGLIYGQTGWGLSQHLGISQDEAQEFMKAYNARYPGVERCRQEILEKARKNGFVTTVLERRRYFPEINSQETAARHGAERAAVNAVFQGSAADLIKVAMNRIFKELEAGGGPLKSRLLLQIHDELLFEAPPEEVRELSARAEEIMESAVKLSVPLKVSVGSGPNWLEVK